MQATIHAQGYCACTVMQATIHAQGYCACTVMQATIHAQGYCACTVMQATIHAQGYCRKWIAWKLPGVWWLLGNCQLPLLVCRLALWVCRFHTAKNRPPYIEIVSSTNAATEIPIIFTLEPIFVLYMCSSVQSWCSTKVHNLYSNLFPHVTRFQWLWCFRYLTIASYLTSNTKLYCILLQTKLTKYYRITTMFCEYPT